MHQGQMRDGRGAPPCCCSRSRVARTCHSTGIQTGVFTGAPPVRNTSTVDIATLCRGRGRGGRSLGMAIVRGHMWSRAPRQKTLWIHEFISTSAQKCSGAAEKHPPEAELSSLRIYVHAESNKVETGGYRLRMPASFGCADFPGIVFPAAPLFFIKSNAFFGTLLNIVQLGAGIPRAALVHGFSVSHDGSCSTKPS